LDRSTGIQRLLLPAQQANFGFGGPPMGGGPMRGGNLIVNDKDDGDAVADRHETLVTGLKTDQTQRTHCHASYCELVV